MLPNFFAVATLTVSATDVTCTTRTSLGVLVTYKPGEFTTEAELHRVQICQSDGTWSQRDTCPIGSRLFDRQRCWQNCEDARVFDLYCQRMCQCVSRNSLGETTPSDRVDSTALGTVPTVPEVQLGHSSSGYEPLALVTTMFQRYPGYTGRYNIIGNVVVVSTGYSLILIYDFDGLEYGTSGGFHIHEGHHCNDESTIGGHFYSHNTRSSDPWESNKWRSMNNGFGEGVVEIDTGYSSLSYNDYHTIVVHTHSGTRAACAELRPLQQSRRRLVSEPARRLIANMS